MPAGPFNPTEADDVELQIAPVNAAGEPTTGPFDWALSDGAAGTLTVAYDKLSAKLVTAAGPLDAVISVTDPRTGVVDTAQVVRIGPDNNTTVMNLSGAVVPKVPQ